MQAKKEGRKVGLYEGKKMVMDSAFRQGFETAFDSLYPLNLRKGQGARLNSSPNTRYILNIEYEKIARFIAQ